MEYPYQIVTFLDAVPVEGQSIYGDENGGWLAHVALKRRFALKDFSEDQFVQEFALFCASTPAIVIKTLTVQKLDRMPVEVITIERSSDVDMFHQAFLSHFEQQIVSKYPDREGEAYLPHITAEYWDKRVIDVVPYENKSFPVNSVWLTKDAPNGQNTHIFKQFKLGAIE